MNLLNRLRTLWTLGIVLSSIPLSTTLRKSGFHRGTHKKIFNNQLKYSDGAMQHSSRNEGSKLGNVSHYPQATFTNQNDGTRQLSDVNHYHEANLDELKPNSNNGSDKLKTRLEEFREEDYFEMEVQVLLDSVLVEAIKGRTVEFLEYVKIFFNSMNHIYKNSHSNEESFPTFKLKVVEIKELDLNTEMEIFVPIEGEAYEVIDIEKVLVYLRKKSKKMKFDKYDHTMLLTGRDLHRKSSDKYDSDVLGVAFLNGACTKLSDGKHNSLSVVEDVGAHFLGVYPAVHEIAHNLGAKHDSKTTSSYSCHAKRGYIMSPVTQRTSNMFQFSECTLSTLREFFYSKQGKCLSKEELKPVFPEESSPKLPGDVYTMKDICDHLAEGQYPNEVSYETKVNPGKSASFLCKQISCKVTLSSGRVIVVEPPFAPGENVPCGNDGRCVSGECVNQLTNDF